MTTTAIQNGFGKLPAAKTRQSEPRSGAINAAIVQLVKDIYATDTIKTLASWLHLTIKTAKNRLQEEREFNLEEVAQLLASEHGFRVLSTIMDAASKRPGYRVPDWWAMCEPLMDLADAERLCVAVRKRTNTAIRKREDVADALETEIRRAQTVAIHGPGPASEHLKALQSYAGAERRVVAPKPKR